MSPKISRSIFVLLFLFTQLIAQAFNVTFRVDMSQQGGFTTPEVNGSFNNWCGNCFQMSDLDGDNIWEATTNLAAGNYEYKFSADGWGSQETLLQGSPCTVTNFGFTNRSLVVSQDVVLPVVCWGACVECAAAPVNYDVTFQVDMNEQTGFTTPEVNGTFNGWCGNCTSLQDADGDGIWSVTLTLQQGNYEYKFSHDNWSGQESLTPGSECTITTDIYTNRVLSLTEDVVLSPVCYGSCAACGISTGPFDVTFELDMNQVALPFNTPEINGTFNGWCGSCTPMSDPDGDNIWSVSIPLLAGSYDYKFSFDNWTGQENLAPGTSCTSTTDIYTNRTITIDGPMNVGAVCWESCSPCNTVSLNQMNLPVSFDDSAIEYGLLGFDGSEDATIVVDPTNASNMVARVTKSANAGASSGVTVTAPAELGFSSPVPFIVDATTMSVRVWSPDAGIQVRLKVEDHNDPTHSVETNVNTTVANDWETLVFDFANQSAGTAALNLNYLYDKASIFFNFGVDGATAGEKTYYFDDLEFGGEVVVVAQYNVTFQVDMQNVTGFTTPEVNGTFNGWCGGCFPLTDVDGDGIWTGTASIPEGTHEYKFAYDSWAGSENLIPGSSCTVTTDIYTNRSLDVSGDLVLPLVCWESCDDCASSPESFDVTFQVDMNGVSGFTTPEVNGTFNNWCGSCFQMSDNDGDGVWTATTTLQAGNYEYKYSFDNWTGQEQLTPGDACTVTNGAYTNRTLSIESDTILSTVCWALCDPCSTPEPALVTLNLDLGDVVATSAEVSGTFNDYCIGCQPMTSLGNNQYTVTLEVLPGVHYYRFTIDGGTITESLTEGTCTVDFKFGVVRELVVSEAVNVGAVCWESCTPCAVGVQETPNIELSIMPNPANSVFNFECPYAGVSNYSLADMTGRIVLAGTTAGLNKVEVNVQELPAGLYQLSVGNGSNSITQKVIVQH